jgi:hypothetical protein
MSKAKSISVTETRGNVVFCDFGAQTRNPEDRERNLPTVLAAVSTSVAEINGATREILGTNLATAQVGVDNSNLLFVTLGRIDNLAFQCNAIAVDPGCTDGDECGVGRIADDVRKLVAKAADATRRLRRWCRTKAHGDGGRQRAARDLRARGRDRNEGASRASSRCTLRFDKSSSPITAITPAQSSLKRRANNRRADRPARKPRSPQPRGADTTARKSLKSPPRAPLITLRASKGRPFMHTNTHIVADKAVISLQGRFDFSAHREFGNLCGTCSARRTSASSR